ncbi:MAG: tRNA (adenosine(37)-N6)-dimethylallyltransferase MiaA [Alphaproteobacteria bacterium]|nr:tRNA (adenosine(37)-N6)-dimethylallyltransferase MiaA [Alphaproteobacteria bacterium]
MSLSPEIRDCEAVTVDAVLIAGPTASGKSAAALSLARAHNGVVINADSMQVYREVSILSARPSQADSAAAPHLLYGHVGAEERYSVGRYQIDAIAALAEARKAGRLPVFVGGTGLYFAALTEGLAEIPPVPADIRAEARDRLDALGVAGLHAELAARDPETAAQLRPTDPQRVLRAYEVHVATGRPLASWQRQASKPVLAGLSLARFVLDVPRYELRERIRRRFLAMMEAGARIEAAALQGLDPTLPAAKILGLRELWALDAGVMTEADAVSAAVTATRQFAKRQTTWFRNRMADWAWLQPDDNGNFITSMRQVFS